MHCMSCRALVGMLFDMISSDYLTESILKTRKC